MRRRHFGVGRFAGNISGRNQLEEGEILNGNEWKWTMEMDMNGNGVRKCIKQRTRPRRKSAGKYICRKKKKILFGANSEQ